MSPFPEPTENMSFEAKEELVSDTSKFRRWMIERESELNSKHADSMKAIGEVDGKVSIINRFGCDALRSKHGAATEEDDENGVSWKSPLGLIKAHGLTGFLFLLVAIILFMQFRGASNATTNTDKAEKSEVRAVVDRGELAKAVRDAIVELKTTGDNLKQDDITLLRESKENKASVNTIKENQRP